MIRRIRPVLTHEMTLFGAYLDQIVRHGPGEPERLPTEPVPLTELANRLHHAAEATPVAQEFAEDLLARLLSRQQEQNIMNSQAAAIAGEPLSGTPRTFTERETFRLNWATVLTAVLAVALLATIWNTFRDRNDVPVLIVPTTVATPDDAPGTPESFPFAAEEIWRSNGGVSPLDGPGGVEIAPDGSIWVADTGNDRFAIFAPDGTFMEYWGESGDQPGQFDFARDALVEGNRAGDVAWGPDGRFYVADSGNFRIQVFDSERAFVTTWGSRGGGPGQFGMVFAVTVGPDGSVYVSDDQRNTILRFAPDGTYLGQVGTGGPNPGQVLWQGGIRFDDDGVLWVADWENHRVNSYDQDGEFRHSFGGYGTGPGQFDQATDVGFDAAGNVYAGDNANQRVHVFTTDGVLLGSLDTNGLPGGLAVGTDGVVYVAGFDTGYLTAYQVTVPNGSPPEATAIGRLDGTSEPVEQPYAGPAGASASPLWSTSTEPVRVDMTTSVSVAPDGTVWVADGVLNVFHIFGPDGTYIEDWGEPGAGDGQFAFSADRSRVFRYLNIGQVLFAPDGSFFVSDPGNGRIQKFTADRTFELSFGNAGVEASIVGESAGPMFLIGAVQIGVIDRSTVDGPDVEMVVYSLNGEFRQRVSFPGAIPLVFLPDGSYWAASTSVSNQRDVRHYGAGGNVLATLDSSAWGSDIGFIINAAVDAGGNLYLPIQGAGEIAVFEPDGSLLMRFRGVDSPFGVMASPSWVTLDGDGNLLIADWTRYSVDTYGIVLP